MKAVDMGDMTSHCHTRSVYLRVNGLGCGVCGCRCAPTGFAPGTVLDVSDRDRTVRVEVLRERGMMITALQQFTPAAQPVFA